MSKNKKIQIDGKEISIITNDKVDFISLTDMSRSQMHEAVIIKWLSLKSTIEYLGEWEMLYNPIFNSTEFGRIKNLAESNNFVLSVKQWIENTNAIGISAKLSNLESINAMLIHQGIEQLERLLQLNEIAVNQMKSLINNKKLLNSLK